VTLGSGGLGLVSRPGDDQPDLEGLTALVTGATSGIGKAAAEELGRQGAEIVVHGRDADRGPAVAGAIAAAGGKARFVAADLTDPARLDYLAGQAGPVDVLVNNAGFSWFGPAADLDAAAFDRLFAMTGVLLTHEDDTEARAAHTVTAEGQPACPFCDPLGGRFSGPFYCLPAWPGWPMKSSSAWLTSSAWVQMIACGPPAMMVERAFFSSAGSLPPVAS